MKTDITELAAVLRIAAESEIACRAEGDTSDLWQDEASPDNVLALVEALEKAQTENTAGAAGMAESYETTISMLRSRIASLEESHAQVIQSRDHYKRMLEEGLEQLAEPRTVTVKLPQAVSAGGQGYQEQVERILTAAGIKWEAE
uniref:ead/Ea22-like family protein n=1 Tax=Klebsiella aerogenes TaxID=548 RepID=UPI001F43A342|nr:ead/Ea22-like family protein [Klebsiella aerogenes]